jgi:hypothetical protein
MEDGLRVGDSITLFAESLFGFLDGNGYKCTVSIGYAVVNDFYLSGTTGVCMLCHLRTKIIALESRRVSISAIDATIASL